MITESIYLLKNIRTKGYDGSLSAYRAAGGYKQLQDMLATKKPEDIIELVKESGLRGRGGAGFPTGMKWSFMAKNTGKPSYLVCNADESEPGTFKDHLLLEYDPHLFIEGLIMGCYAIDCHTSYTYVRGESFRAIDRLQAAIDELYSEGLLGKSVFGSKFSLDLFVHPGAGAYICGEETALLDSLEGKRGQPRFKPPFPAVSGFDQSPTSVNNVETLCCVPIIYEIGAKKWIELGSPNNSGTHLVSISGMVEKPGVYEVSMGLSLLKIIEDLAGGVRGGKKLKAVIPGGASSPVLKSDEVDVPYEFDSLMKMGTMMGSSAVMVFDEDTSMLDVAERTIRFFNHESCGQCTPCREGTFWLKNIVRDFIEGETDQQKLGLLDKVAAGMAGTTICAFGDAVSGPMRAFVKKFPQDFLSN